jgi:hypothetical protein
MACSIVATVALVCASCSGQDARLQQHHERFESLASSVNAIGRAWLGGRTSGTYTGTALEQIFLLVEKERRALASTPATLVDPRGAQLSESAERLSRVIAAIQHDIRRSDAASVRKHLSGLSNLTPERQ